MNYNKEDMMLNVLTKIGTNVAVFTGTFLGSMVVFKGVDLVVEAVSKKRKTADDKDDADEWNSVHGYR